MLLRDYYKDWFPFQLIYRWLNYRDASLSQSRDNNTFPNREISFMLPGNIYVRFQSYNSWNEFRNNIIDRNPLKIDSGAVYNDIPKNSKFSTLVKAKHRELVFDIDISDYNDVRFCCTESNMCPQCWPLMKTAAKILYKLLTEHLGFKHIIFVYSGRRGFHCWVSDKKARALDNRARSAIASYFKVIEGGLNQVKRVRLTNYNRFHPVMQTGLEVIDQDFENIMIEKQDFVSDESRRQTLIDLAEDYTIKNKLTERRQDKVSSKQYWAAATQIARSTKKTSFFIEEVKLQCCYPRLDENVTKGLNHLLKLPFSVHPNTNNVCVPFSFDMIDSFDPFSIPKMNEIVKTHSNALEPYVEALKEHVNSLEAANLKEYKFKRLNELDLNFN